MFLMFEVSKIITTSLDSDNFVGAQIESFSEGSPYSELYMNGFFRSIPYDETEKGACTGVQIFDGSDMFVLPGTDARIIPLLPVAKKGSSTQANYDGVKCDFSHFDDSGYSLLVHDGADDHLIKVDKNTHCISIIQKDGSAIELSGDSITLRTSGATATISGSKLQVFGDIGVTGSISQVGGRSLVFADALIARLTALEATIDGKTPLPGNPAGAAVQLGISASLLSTGLGSTLNTLVQ